MGGGASNAGTVFKVTPAGALTTLYSFGTVPSDGSYPNAGLIQASDGNLYGTTFNTVFRITLSGVLTTVWDFSGNVGTQFTPLMQASDGNLYE